MKKIIAKIPKGFNEYLPKDQLKFNNLIKTIQKTYELFGFYPIETPSLELKEILLSKGGGETEKEVFELKKGNTDYIMPYDLTVPLARYVVEHKHEITFPFRRYQIQKVWRAEKPQRGRYREFYQADIDIVGDNSTITDAEIPAVIYKIFKNLNMDSFIIKINNRKILNGIIDFLKLNDKSTEILRIIDKLDKVDIKQIKNLLTYIKIPKNKINFFINFINLKGTNQEILQKLHKLKINNNTFNLGLKELKSVYGYMNNFQIDEKNIAIDLKIARGFDYYTGTVYETVLTQYPKLGSICSGGRYDNLTGYFTNKIIPGVGISIGVNRLYDFLVQKEQSKQNSDLTTKVMIICLSHNLLSEGVKISHQLRNKNIKTLLYTQNHKIQKQLKYALKLNIPYIIFIGEDEVKKSKYTLKELSTQNQFEMYIKDIIKKLSNK
jgi:histidyl-tRNA synthetase